MMVLLTKFANTAHAIYFCWAWKGYYYILFSGKLSIHKEGPHFCHPMVHILGNYLPLWVKTYSFVYRNGPIFPVRPRPSIRSRAVFSKRHFLSGTFDVTWRELRGAIKCTNTYTTLRTYWGVDLLWSKASTLLQCFRSQLKSISVDFLSPSMSESTSTNSMFTYLQVLTQ